MKKIIITGVAGFIGSALASILSKEYEIIGIDKQYWTGFDFLHEQGRKVTFFQTDINDSLPGFTKDIYAVILSDQSESNCFHRLIVERGVLLCRAVMEIFLG